MLVGGGALKCLALDAASVQLSRNTSLAQMSQFSMPGLQASVGKSPLGFQVEQLASLALAQVVHPAQVAGQHQHAAISIEDFRPPVGPLDALAVADGAVVGQDHHVGLLHERQHGFGELLPAGRFVGGDRHVAQEHLDLGQHALRDRLRAIAKAVACGGWQCTTLFMSVRSFMIARCSRISLLRLRRP